MQTETKKTVGVALLVFGVIFLIKQLHILPNNVGHLLFDPRNYLLILGVIFLIFSKNKSIGLILLGITILIRLDWIRHWTHAISDYLIPIVLIGIGSIILFRNKRTKK